MTLPEMMTSIALCDRAREAAAVALELDRGDPGSRQVQQIGDEILRIVSSIDEQDPHAPIFVPKLLEALVDCDRAMGLR